MAAELVARLKVDTSGLQAAMRKAQASIRSLAPVFQGLAVAGAAAGAAVAAAAYGVKKALDLGGELNDLSASTGVAAGDIMVLQQAFKDTGVGAEKVGPVVAKMQKAIAGAASGTGPAAEAFGKLGLSAESLSSMGANDAMKAIGDAIMRVQNPAQRAAFAMQIFGRSGASMLALFGDSGALADAAKTLGGQSDVMTQSAGVFDRASDLINNAGVKLQGFFVGMADAVAPVLLPLLEQAQSLDLTGLGQQIGNAAAIFIAAMTDGSIWQIMGDSALLALSNAANFLWGALMAIAKALAQYVIEVIKGWVTLFSVVASPGFWAGLFNTFVGITETFAGKLLEGAAGLAQALLSGVIGAARAFGAYLPEVAKTAVLAFSVLTRGEFWAGMVAALVGAARNFRAVLLETVATLLDKISVIPGLGIAADGAKGLRDMAAGERAAAAESSQKAGDLLGPIGEEMKARLAAAGNAVAQAYGEGAASAPDIASGMRAAGQALQDRGAQAKSQGDAQLGPIIDRVGGQISQAGANIGAKFMEGWNGPGLIDTSGMQGRLDGTLGGLAEKVAKMQSDAREKFKNKPVAPGEQDAMATGPAAKADKAGPLFASSMMAVGGGGFQVGGADPLMEENRRHTRLLETIAKNTASPRRAAAPAPADNGWENN